MSLVQREAHERGFYEAKQQCLEIMAEWAKACHPKHPKTKDPTQRCGQNHGLTSAMRSVKSDVILMAIVADGAPELLSRLSFAALRDVNVTRCARWHGPGSEPWNAADWSNATCGEAGEMANIIKKIRRHETRATNEGDPPLDELKKMAAAEMADVVIYVDLLANYLGVDLGAAIQEKFNKTSEKYGFPERL